MALASSAADRRNGPLSLVKSVTHTDIERYISDTNILYKDIYERNLLLLFYLTHRNDVWRCIKTINIY